MITVCFRRRDRMSMLKFVWLNEFVFLERLRASQSSRSSLLNRLEYELKRQELIFHFELYNFIQRFDLFCWYATKFLIRYYLLCCSLLGEKRFAFNHVVAIFMKRGFKWLCKLPRKEINRIQMLTKIVSTRSLLATISCAQCTSQNLNIIRRLRNQTAS